MDQSSESTPAVDRHVSGPLDRAAAGQLLDQGAALLESGDYPEGFSTWVRNSE